MSYPFSASFSLVLSERLVQFAQFMPEEQRQNCVWPEPEIRGSQTFVESHQALLPQCLGKAVNKSFIKLALKMRRLKISLDQNVSSLFRP